MAKSASRITLAAVIFVLCFLDLFSTSSGATNTMDILQLKCHQNDKYAKHLKCEAKSLNRTLKVLNVSFTLTKQIANPEVHLKMYRKPLLTPGPYMKLQFVDGNFCELITGRMSIFFNLQFNHSKNYTNLPFKCPIEPGDYYFKNIPYYSTNYLPLLPPGRYRHKLEITNNNESVCYGDYDVEQNRYALW